MRRPRLAAAVPVALALAPHPAQGADASAFASAATAHLATAHAATPEAPAPCARSALPADSLATGARAWPAPLDRVIPFRAEDVPLRVALDRLAAAARVRFSYSPELLPLDRAVCVSSERTSLGDALVALLAGTRTVPVVAGGDQVVLAPGRSAAAADATPARARSTEQLERVVVTGTATGGAERASPFALSVVDGQALEREGARSLAEALDGTVPGIWLWSQSPTSPIARYGSIRGASSFGVSTPKIYVDGVEVANPLLLTQIDPARVQRVEVIRGPQGAALYGAEAISGVVQIVTRQEGVGPGAPAAEVRGSAGSTSSAYADGGVLVQDHSAVLRAGAAARSASLGVTVSTLGAFIPGATARQLLGHASARRVGPRSVLSGSARLSATDAESPVSPLLAGLAGLAGGLSGGTRAGGAPGAAADAEPAQPRVDSVGHQRVRQYTVGGTLTAHASGRWTHVAIAGVDGYRLAGVAAEGMLVPSAADSALRAARGGADRGTLRVSATGRWGAAETRALSLTFGAEHSTAREETNGEGTRLAGPPSRGGPQPNVGPLCVCPTPVTAAAAAGTTWWHNSGLLAQGQLTLRGGAFLTGGARVERIAGPASGAQVTLLPMLGGAWVRERGAGAVKLRAAYGRGIRPARTVARGATWTGGRVSGSLAALEPEEQSGVEAGVDLLWGARFGVHATRFDQRVSGLVQPVALLADHGGSDGAGGPGGGPGGQRGPRIVYELQNVGAIANRGWEFQATGAVGPLTLAGALSLVGSRVDRLATGYRGDLRAGDRILEVPARTLGLDASWARGPWTAALSVARGSAWINYDRLALAHAIAQSSAGPASGAGGAQPPVGTQLRAFWREYDGVTRLGARASLALWRGTSLTLAGSNLLDRQLDEPDNVTVLPGRSVTLGMRAGF